MAILEVTASGLEYLTLATQLLRRVRLADPLAGVWEAADLQWWWRTPRASDAIGQQFWFDEEGPVAAVVLTDWGRVWQCDPILVRGVADALLNTVWTRAVEAIAAMRLDTVEMMARDDDSDLLELLARSGFVADDAVSGITWMRAEDRPEVATLPDGLVLVDRSQHPAGAHPMRRRSGAMVEARLQQCSLYDPSLDLAVEASDGRIAGYALFWFDPVTEVGMVEPMRVEDAYQRHGLARALLTAGLDRLAQRGAQRLKVGYGSEAGRKLYVGAGFVPSAPARLYRRKGSQLNGLTTIT